MNSLKVASPRVKAVTQSMRKLHESRTRTARYFKEINSLSQTRNAQSLMQLVNRTNTSLEEKTNRPSRIALRLVPFFDPPMRTSAGLCQLKVTVNDEGNFEATELTKERTHFEPIQKDNGQLYDLCYPEGSSTEALYFDMARPHVHNLFAGRSAILNVYSTLHLSDEILGTRLNPGMLPLAVAEALACVQSFHSNDSPVSGKPLSTTAEFTMRLRVFHIRDKSIHQLVGSRIIEFRPKNLRNEPGKGFQIDEPDDGHVVTTAAAAIEYLAKFALLRKQMVVSGRKDLALLYDLELERVEHETSQFLSRDPITFDLQTTATVQPVGIFRSNISFIEFGNLERLVLDDAPRTSPALYWSVKIARAMRGDPHELPSAAVSPLLQILDERIVSPLKGLGHQRYHVDYVFAIPGATLFKPQHQFFHSFARLIRGTNCNTGPVFEIEGIRDSLWWILHSEFTAAAKGMDEQILNREGSALHWKISQIKKFPRPDGTPPGVHPAGTRPFSLLCRGLRQLVSQLFHDALDKESDLFLRGPLNPKRIGGFISGDRVLSAAWEKLVQDITIQAEFRVAPQIIRSELSTDKLDPLTNATGVPRTRWEFRSQLAALLDQIAIAKETQQEKMDEMLHNHSDSTDFDSEAFRDDGTPEMLARLYRQPHFKLPTMNLDAQNQDQQRIAEIQEPIATKNGQRHGSDECDESVNYSSGSYSSEQPCSRRSHHSHRNRGSRHHRHHRHHQHHRHPPPPQGRGPGCPVEGHGSIILRVPDVPTFADDDIYGILPTSSTDGGDSAGRVWQNAHRAGIRQYNVEFRGDVGPKN